MTLDEAREVLNEFAIATDPFGLRSSARRLEDAVRVIVRDEITTHAYVHDFGDSPGVQAAEIWFHNDDRRSGG